MILYIEASKAVARNMVKYDLDNSCDDVLSISDGAVKVQGLLAKKINDYFKGNAYEIKTVKELKRILQG